MGTLRTIIAWLGVSTLGLVSGLPHVTLADDTGPGKEVRAIRHDLPLLLAGRLDAPVHQQVAIERVSVSRDTAVVEWHAGDMRRSESLVRRYDRWWIDGETPVAAKALPAPSPGGGLSKAGFVFGEMYFIDALGFDDRVQRPTTLLDGYQMAVTMAQNDASTGDRIRDVRGRPPTEAESWAAPDGNGYFFFSGTVQSSAPVHVRAGTTIDVWFPFVLDPSLYYGLTIAHADKPIGPIDGTLKDNVVHFVLPAFTLPPGATLMAEIDGDSFRQSL